MFYFTKYLHQADQVKKIGTCKIFLEASEIGLPIHIFFNLILGWDWTPSRYVIGRIESLGGDT